MKTKWIIFGILIVAVGVLWYWSGMDQPVTSPGIQSATSPDRRAKMKENERTVHNVRPTAELPTVSRVTLAIRNGEGKRLSSVNIEPGIASELAGTSYRLRITDFYTYLNWNNGPVNLSYTEGNPAVKVEVLQDDSVLYHQWAFKKVEFFGSGGEMGHPGEVAKNLSFTLLEYEGLVFPGHEVHGEEGE